MKTGKDFREAFPPMDEGFRRAVLHALDETGKERMMVKKKIRVSVVVAAVIVLLAFWPDGGDGKKKRPEGASERTEPQA